jgi:hypothetical protein
MVDKLHVLVRKLTQYTQSGKLQWETTPTDGIYQASFPNYSVRLFHRPSADQEGALDYWLEVLDEQGAVVDEFSDTALQQTGFTGAYKFMENLFQSARRSAMGADRAIDSILSALEEKAPELKDDDMPF